MAVEAIKQMKSFHADLHAVMLKHGFDLVSNLGRRNILLSQAQEKFFAEQMSRTMDVTTSGRTGEPDITIRCLGRELECKLTSPSATGALNFQTDHDTLVRKGSVDYLYVVADADFEQFAAFHYTDLGIEDFGPVANGSRGKVQLLKHKAFDRLNILVGGVKNLNEIALDKLHVRYNKARAQKSKDRILKSIDYWTSEPTRFAIELEKV
jgi:hypothetical protein